MFYQIFLSPQVKRWAIIIYKHGNYEFPQGLLNDLRLRILGPHGIFADGGAQCPHKKKERLRILGNLKISRKRLNLVE